MKRNKTDRKVGFKPRYETTELREKIMSIIALKWPTYMSEIVRELGLSTEKKNLLWVKYNVDQLAREGKIRIKKIDRAAVCWPADIEKIRIVHEFLQEGSR